MDEVPTLRLLSRIPGPVILPSYESSFFEAMDRLIKEANMRSGRPPKYIIWGGTLIEL